MRQLNYALNEKQEKILIDSLSESNKLSNKIYFCPNCKKQVIPKLGNEKTWHFAHKDGECFTESVEYKQMQHTNLDSFHDENAKQELTPSAFFQCPICKKEQKKEFGIKVNEFVYFCKNCYNQSTPSDLAKFF